MSDITYCQCYCLNCKNFSNFTIDEISITRTRKYAKGDCPTCKKRIQRQITDEKFRQLVNSDDTIIL